MDRRESGQLHAKAALPPGKEPIYSLNTRRGGQHSRPEIFGGNRNHLRLPRIEPRYLCVPSRFPAKVKFYYFVLCSFSK